MSYTGSEVWFITMLSFIFGIIIGIFIEKDHQKRRRRSKK